MTGRGYPTPERAREVLIAALDKSGLKVDPSRVVADKWAEGGFCPWEAYIMLDDAEYAAILGDPETRDG